MGRRKRHITGFMFAGVCGVNVCCLRNTMERNLELRIYGDQLRKVEEDDVICLSLSFTIFVTSFSTILWPTLSNFA